MDGLIGRMKTRKWTNRILFHLFNLALVNSYILYHRLHERSKCQLPNFRTEVAESLCLVGATQSRGRGRPSSQPASPLSDAPKSKRSYLPSDNVRYDQIGHWCDFLERSGKKICKMPGCKSETQAFCTKCKLNLCNSSTKKCFFLLHNRQ